MGAKTLSHEPRLIHMSKDEGARKQELSLDGVGVALAGPDVAAPEGSPTRREQAEGRQESVLIEPVSPTSLAP